MNAPYLDNNPLQRHDFRERRYPFLALIDALLGWTIGLSALAIGLYAIGRVLLFFFPSVFSWIHVVM